MKALFLEMAITYFYVEAASHPEYLSLEMKDSTNYQVEMTGRHPVAKALFGFKENNFFLIQGFSM